MAILTEFFRLLELRDRVSATAETYQKKLIRRFKTAKEENKLRGAMPRVVQADIDKEQNFDAAKAIVNYFAEGDPTKQNKYLDWIIRQWIKGHLLWEDSFKMKNLLTDFEKYRKKLDRKDLNQYESYHDLEEALEPLRGTEVAGVRVQNFLKKADVQKFRDNKVADPTHAMNHEGYESLYGEDDTAPSVPDWYEDQVRESAQEWAGDAIDMDDLIDEAKAELDDEDYTDEDGDVDEDAMQRDAEDAAENEYTSRVESYIDEYVREHAQSEWEEYWEEQREHDEHQLTVSRHQAPELDVVYENDRLAVLIPNSKDAACFIGKGTEWCTAAEESENYWWEYTKDAPLFAVVTDKLGKFQFHFDTDQYMDEHDRYIEDSNALISLVRRYPKELEEAFGEIARDQNEWWLLPAEEIPSDTWDQMEGQMKRDIGEDATRDVVRVWQAHHTKAPEGWAERVRKSILASSHGEKAVKYGWFGKTEDHEVDELVKLGLQRGTINAERTAAHIAQNNIEVSPEAWHGLIMKGTNSMFYAPLELIDRQLLDDLMGKNLGSGYGRTSFLADFYYKFKELINRAEKSIDPEATFDHPAHPWSQGGLERARKLAGLITMDDIIDSVLKYPDTITKYEMDFGMKPWMALARKVLTSEEEHDVGEFLHQTIRVINQNKDEPWTKDLSDLVHQILAKHPEEAQSIARYPKGEISLAAQNSIINHISAIQGNRQRSDAANRFSNSIEDSGALTPEAEEVLKSLRRYAHPDEPEYQQLRKAVPDQQQLEM